jgi:hypothetical protein
MAKLTPRDYGVSALIIIGVPLIWFLLVAALMGHTNAGVATSVVVIISFIVYLILKRNKPL